MAKSISAARSKPGAPFEHLTAVLFGGLAASDLNRVITVRKNVILRGKTTHHEVDAFWNLQIGNISYETVIQAKDWAKAVDQGEVLKLKGVLDDLPNQPRGLIVSTRGFQRGAKAFAAANGILLFELVNDSPYAPMQMTTASIALVKVEYRQIPVVRREARGWTVRRRQQPFFRQRVMIPEDIHILLHVPKPEDIDVLPNLDPTEILLIQPGHEQRKTIAGLLQEGLQHASKYTAERWAACWIYNPSILLERRDGLPLARGVWAIEADFRIATRESERPFTSKRWINYVIRDVLSSETSSIRLDQDV